MQGLSQCQKNLNEKKREEEAAQRSMCTCLLLMCRTVSFVHVFAYTSFAKPNPIARCIQRHFNKMKFEFVFLYLSVIVSYSMGH